MEGILERARVKWFWLTAAAAATAGDGLWIKIYLEPVWRLKCYGYGAVDIVNYRCETTVLQNCSNIITV